MIQVHNVSYAYVDGVATDTTGVKLTYTAPGTGTAAIPKMKARIIALSWFNNSGTPTVDLELYTVGGVTIKLGRSAVAFDGTAYAGLILNPGDALRFNVTSAAAGGSTADAYFAVEILTVS